MRLFFAAFVAVLTITISVALAPSPSPGEGVSRVMTVSRHTSPMTLDGLNEAARSETDRRTYLEAAMHALKARQDAEKARAAESARRASQARTAPQSPAPAPSGCGYADAIRARFGADGDWAVAIAWRESRCTPGAKSPTGCWGLFQLCVPLHLGIFRHVCPDLTAQLGNAVALDPSCNIAAAKHLYDGSGRAPWAL